MTSNGNTTIEIERSDETFPTADLPQEIAWHINQNTRCNYYKYTIEEAKAASLEYCVLKEYKYLYQTLPSIKNNVDIKYVMGINPFFCSSIYTGSIQRLIHYLKMPLNDEQHLIESNLLAKEFVAEYRKTRKYFINDNVDDVQLMSDLYGVKIEFYDADAIIIKRGLPYKAMRSNENICNEINSMNKFIAICKKKNMMYALLYGSADEEAKIKAISYKSSNEYRQLADVKLIVKEAIGIKYPRDKLADMSNKLYHLYSGSFPDIEERLNTLKGNNAAIGSFYDIHMNSQGYQFSNIILSICPMVAFQECESCDKKCVVFKICCKFHCLECYSIACKNFIPVCKCKRSYNYYSHLMFLIAAYANDMVTDKIMNSLMELK